MLFDIRITPAALKRAAGWVEDGPGRAEVEMLLDDTMLLVEQGDERMAWDMDGRRASEAYLAAAPVRRLA